MGLKIDISLIFSRIKNHYGIKNDAELARFLGIPSTTLSNWKSRGNPNWALLFSKCESMDFNVLIKGTGIKLPGAVQVPPDKDTVIHLIQMIENKDDRLQILAQTNGELKYENKQLRKQLGYSTSNNAAETPGK